MGRAIVRTVAGTAALLIVASALVFALVRSAPGDPVDVQLGQIGGAGLLQADVDRIRAERLVELGLDRPVVEQYVDWLGRMLTGDWGTSYLTGQPVLAEMADRFPATLGLGTAGFGTGVVVAAGLALIASRRPGSPTDHGIRLVTLLTVAVPSFLLGTIALQLGTAWFDYPVAGPGTAERIWLPALVLGVAISPTLSRVLRASLIAEGGRLYAIAATARGVPPGRRLVRHVLRPAASPVLTLAGMAFASLITGAVITEAVFSWPGIGLYAVDAIAAQDYPVVQAYVLVATALVVVVNRGIDLAQRLLDPRDAARTAAVS